MALTSKPPRSNLKPIYERLSSGTKEALTLRVEEMKRVTGNEELEAWDALGPGNLFYGDRVSKVSLLEESDTSAKVEVTMKPFVKDSSEANTEDSKSVIINLLKEDGQWRVDLPLKVPSS